MGFHEGITLAERDFEQTQLLYCFEGLPAGDKDRYAAAVFSTIAGGSASSRLKPPHPGGAGAWPTRSTALPPPIWGAGIFGVGAGVSPGNQRQVLEESMEILLALRGGVDEKELARTKEQFKANLVMGMTQRSTVGRGLLLENRYVDEDAILAQIDALTEADIQRVARHLVTPSRMALAAVGHPAEEKQYVHWLRDFR